MILKVQQGALEVPINLLNNICKPREEPSYVLYKIGPLNRPPPDFVGRRGNLVKWLSLNDPAHNILNPYSSKGVVHLSLCACVWVWVCVCVCVCAYMQLFNRIVVPFIFIFHKQIFIVVGFLFDLFQLSKIILSIWYIYQEGGEI